METNKTKRSDIYSIDPRNIIVKDGFNSRVNFGDIDELAQQIKEKGMLNPVTVQTIKTPDGDKYQLVDGERRYRAVMKLIEDGENIPYIKAMMVSPELTKSELYVQQAMRNEGKNFNEYEWAILANKLKSECGIENNSEIARMLGKNAGVVSYWLQILSMPEDFQDLVRTGKLCGADLRRILQANDKDYDKARADIKVLEEKAMERVKQAENKPENKTEQQSAEPESKQPETPKKPEQQTKLTLRDLDFSTNTKAFRDSKAILTALDSLDKVIQHIAPNSNISFDTAELRSQLQSGKLITDIIKEKNKEMLREAN